MWDRYDRSSMALDSEDSGMLVAVLVLVLVTGASQCRVPIEGCWRASLQ